MKTLIICIAGLAFSSLLGAYIGLFAKNASTARYRIILAFSIGIMLYASFSDLIIPSVNNENLFKFLTAVIGFVSGIVFISLIESAPDFLKNFVKTDKTNENLDSILLFITAVAIHKFPEGLASGLALSSSNAGISLTLGIALQNIPDGLIVSAPLVSSGVSRLKAFTISAVTALISTIGTIIGYFCVNLLKNADAFSLSFAGAMLLTVTFTIIDEIRFTKKINFGIAFGILLMIIFEKLI